MALKENFSEEEIKDLLKKVGFEIDQLETLSERECKDILHPAYDYDGDYDPPYVEVSNDKKCRIIVNARKIDRNTN